MKTGMKKHGAKTCYETMGVGKGAPSRQERGRGMKKGYGKEYEKCDEQIVRKIGMRKGMKNGCEQKNMFSYPVK